jgi:hypothetical protein
MLYVYGTPIPLAQLASPSDTTITAPTGINDDDWVVGDHEGAVGSVPSAWLMRPPG